jgi:hypothetical protein
MARTLPLGLAASLGAVLLVPLAPGLASAAPGTANDSAVCLADELTKAQVATLFHQVDAASQTRAEAVHGYRYVLKVQSGGQNMSVVQVGDLVRDRVESSFAMTGSPTQRVKALSNGNSYLLVTRGSGVQEKAALGVIHRSSIWVSQGETDPSDIEFPSSEGTIPAAATCTETDSGATITIAGDEAVTLKVDTSKALLSVTQKNDGGSLTGSMTYTAQYVTDIAGKDRISDNTWTRANVSADQRASLLRWAHVTSGKAKGLAKKAGHTVRASDIQAAARKWPLARSVRSNISSGVVVTANDKDEYTGNVLRVKLTASDATVKIAHNW